MTPKKILSVVVLAVFLCSTGMLVCRWIDGVSGSASAHSARQLAAGSAHSASRGDAPLPTQPEAPAEPAPEALHWVPAPVEGDPVMEQLAATDLSALRAVNEDVVGWIHIPGTRIDYPLTQGEDNNYYLNHAWDNAYNVYGSVFLECRNSPQLTDFNTILYGHNMRDGSMFAALHNYADPEFLRAHPYVYLVTDGGVYRCEIFSTYSADVNSATYGLSFNQRQTRLAFLHMAIENSEVDTGIVPTIHDRIITLSTCMNWGYGARRVVHARLAMVQAEKTTAELSSAAA